MSALDEALAALRGGGAPRPPTTTQGRTLRRRVRELATIVLPLLEDLAILESPQAQTELARLRRLAAAYDETRRISVMDPTEGAARELEGQGELEELDRLDARGREVGGERLIEFSRLAYPDACERIGESVYRQDLYDRARARLGGLLLARAQSDPARWLDATQAWLEVAYRASGLLPAYYMPGPDEPPRDGAPGAALPQRYSYGLYAPGRGAGTGRPRAVVPGLERYTYEPQGILPPTRADRRGPVGVGSSDANAGGEWQYGRTAPMWRGLDWRSVGGGLRMVPIGNYVPRASTRTPGTSVADPGWEAFFRFGSPLSAVDSGAAAAVVARLGVGDPVAVGERYPYPQGAIRRTARGVGDVRMPGEWLVRALAPSTGVCLGSNQCPTQTWIVVRGPASVPVPLLDAYAAEADRVATTGLKFLFAKAGLAYVRTIEARYAGLLAPAQLGSITEIADEFRQQFDQDPSRRAGRTGIEWLRLMSAVGEGAGGWFADMQRAFVELAGVLAEVLPVARGGWYPRFPFVRVLQSIGRDGTPGAERICDTWPVTDARSTASSDRARALEAEADPLLVRYGATSLEELADRSVQSRQLVEAIGALLLHKAFGGG